MQQAEATWKPVPGYEGFYEVSTDGDVRAIARKVPCGNGGMRKVNPKVLKRSYDTDGYPVVGVSLGTKESQRTVKVHQIVMLAFVGPRPEGQETRHLNDVKTDCCLTNLCYGTAVQNWEDRKRNGNGMYGSQNPNWKGGK